MWKWLRIKLGIPSGRVILHFVIIEIILQFIWNWVSNMFTIPLVREVGFLVVFVAGLFAVAWYLPKLTPNLSGASKYRKVRNDYDTESIKYGNIMRDMLKEDVAKLDNCIHVEFRGVKISNTRDKARPFLIFEFSIHSSSVYKMQFDKVPEGHMTYEGQVLKDKPEFAPGSCVCQKPTLLRSQTENIELRQFLLPEMANHIMDMTESKTKRVIFNCNQINIPFDVINPKGEVEATWRCPLPNKIAFCLPADGSTAFPC